MQNTRRFVFTGPESSGKSTMSEMIAGYYDFLLVTEFAREYLENLNRPYTISDVFYIARQQHILEKQSIHLSNKPIVCDTDLTVIYIWLAWKFHYHTDEMYEILQSQVAETHYFLCYPDIDWEDDPLRENPDNRDELFVEYEKLLITLNARYTIIRDELSIRKMTCVHQIDQLLAD